ncbi:hypothetical protein B0H14DRAFT_2954715 [Mycena olivaceomarginata]|nr:hypothetical protein B0H14DRAFT_2954715 [Mycena olivaceomarginata]
MQFNVAFVAAALLASASPAMSATITFFTGAGCTGSTIGGSLTVSGTQCVFLTNSGSGQVDQLFWCHQSNPVLLVWRSARQVHQWRELGAWRGLWMRNCACRFNFESVLVS